MVHVGKIHPLAPALFLPGMHVKIVTRAVHRIRNLEVPKRQLLDPLAAPEAGR